MSAVKKSFLKACFIYQEEAKKPVPPHLCQGRAADICELSMWSSRGEVQEDLLLGVALQHYRSESGFGSCRVRPATLIFFKVFMCGQYFLFEIKLSC